MTETAQTPKPPITQRVEFVDTARGIAMLCIVLGHLGIAPINYVVYSFHVPIFFLITGWFLSTKMDVATFARKRARVLLVPYLVTCLAIILGMTLIAAIKTAAGTDVGVGATFVKWLVASLYGSGSNDAILPAGITEIGAIWFLWATFWGCLALRALLELKQEWLRAFIVCAVAAICAVSGSQWLYLPLSIQSGGVALGYMYIGYLLKRYVLPWAKDLPRAAKIAGIVVAAAGWVFFIFQFDTIVIVRCAVGRTPLSTLGVLCGCLTVMVISWGVDRLLPRLSRALGFLGKYSLIMLCVHLLEMTFISYGPIVDAVQLALGLPHLVAGGVALLLKLAIILTFTVLLARWNPSRKLFGFKPRSAGEPW